MPSLEGAMLNWRVTARKSLSRAAVKPIAGNYLTFLLLAIVGVFSGVLTARQLGASGKGEVAIAQSLIGLFTFVLLLSTDQAYVYFAALTRHHRLPLQALKGGFVAGGVIGGLFAIAATYAGFIFPGQSPEVYVIAAITAPFGTSGLWATSVIQGFGDYRRWNYLRLIPGSAYLASLTLVYGFGRLTTISTMWCFVAGALCFWFATVLVVLRLEPREGASSVERILQRGDGIANWRLLLGYALRVHISSIQSVINTRADISVIAYFTSAATVGRYSVAVSVVAPLAMIGPAVASYLFPRLVSDGGILRIDNILGRVGGCTAVAGLAVACVAPALVASVYGVQFAGLTGTIAVLCAATIPLSLGYVLFAWWKAVGKPQRPAWSEGAGLIVMAGLLPWLVSRYGSAGAALVSLSGYTVSFAVVYALYRQRSKRNDLPGRSKPGGKSPASEPITSRSEYLGNHRSKD